MPKRAELSVRTDVDPAFETDFNAWYDREHMEERVAIPGFRWGRRYQTLDGGPGRYLALYQTESLGTFTSEPYRAAFGNQTAWSIASLGRMRNPSRRVSTVEHETGSGIGAALAVIELGLAVPQGVSKVMEGVQALPGVISQRVLLPDATLSTPLPAEAKEGRVMVAFLLIEANSEQVVRQACVEALKSLSLPLSAAACFRLLWEMRAEDLRVVQR